MDGFRLSNSNSLNFSHNKSGADAPVSYSRGTMEYKKYLGIKQGKSGRWSAQMTFGKTRRYLGSFNTAEEAAEAFARAKEERDAMKRKQKLDEKKETRKSVTKCKRMKSKSCFENTSADKGTDGLWPSSCILNFSDHVSTRAHTNVSDNIVKNNYPGVRQKSSGWWSAEISFGTSGYYMGMFETVEEAANAFDRGNMERDSKKRKQKLGGEEAHKSLKTGKVMDSKPCFESASRVCVCGIDEDHIEAEQACSVDGHEIGSLVLPIRELEQQYRCDFKKESLEIESTYLISEAQNSGAIVGEDNQQSNTSGAGNWLIPESADKEDLEMGIVNSYGQFVGEYSRIDDQLWICRREEDDDNDEMY